MSLRLNMRRDGASVGAVVLCVLALLAIWLNEPSTFARNRLLIWGVSAVPFTLLAGLAVAVLLNRRAVEGRLDADHGFLGRLRSDPGGARAVLGSAAQLSV